MSRELKFRIWLKPTYEHKCEFMDRYGKKLPDLDYRLYTQDDFFDDTWLDTNDYEDIIVEQYIGLKDKNGKEIYEGDILKCILGNKPVVFHDCRYWLGETLDDLFVANLRYDIEVIGNIHENGELLGDTNDTDMGDNEELIKLIEQEEKDGE